LTEDGGLCFDSTYTPSDDSDTVDHGGMRIGSYQGVRKSPSVSFDHAFRQIFQVHLVANPHSRRHHRKIVKCALSPLQNLISFFISVVFVFYVSCIRIVGSVKINLNTVVDNQIHGNGGVDF